MKKLLLLSLYPSQQPIHGGQHRLLQLEQAYRRFGFHVQSAGILGNEIYPRVPGYLPYPGRHTLASVCDPPDLLEDYAIGQWICQDEGAFARLMQTIEPGFDLIHVEQPWLFAAAGRLKAMLNPAAPVIYGSQNLEADLKRGILMGRDDTGVNQSRLAAILTLEQEAARQADLVLAVSEAEAAVVRQWTSRPVVVAANGVAQRPAPGPQALEQLQSTLGSAQYALFAASPHPPNIDGFFDLFVPGLGSFKPDQRLVIAGGAGPAICRDSRIQKMALVGERLINLGYVSEELLAALLGQAHCLVLPITTGAGTNLKTAEALWSGKHIVATSLAMRGFERFNRAPGVQVCDDPVAFKQAIRQAMAQPLPQLDEPDIRARQSVLWTATLEPIRMALEPLLQATGSNS